MSNGYLEPGHLYIDTPPFSSPYHQQQPSKAQEPSTSLVAAQERAARKSVVRRTCLVTTAILICIAGLIFAFLSFICLFHQCRLENRTIVSTASISRVLTISQVTSHVTPLSVPVIMGLFSYLLAVQWLRSSINGGPDRPSPMQLGLLMSMCDGAGISALISSLKYVVKTPPNGQQMIAIPGIFRQALIFLGSLLVITNITAASDSWLHASSGSIVIPSTKPYRSTVEPNFAREINATTCFNANQPVYGSVDPKTAGSCGIMTSAIHHWTAEVGEGIRVVDNSSTIHQMVLTNDQTVIVIPLSIPPNITYTAKTLGVRSQCETVTKRCLAPKTLSDGSLDYGAGGAYPLYLDCFQAGINYAANSAAANSTGGPPGGCALDNQGICAGWDTIPSNPYFTGEVVTSSAYIDPYSSAYGIFLNDTGWFFGENLEWNIVFCNVSMLDITYTYTSSGRYITRSVSFMPLNTSRAIVSPTFMSNGSGTTVVSAAVDGAGYTNDPPYELVYSYELSRQVLGRAAFIYAPAPVFEIYSVADVTGSELQLIPLVIFMASLCIFALQVLFIAIRIIISTWGAQYVELASLHLRDPLITVNRLYGQPNPVLTWDAQGGRKFGDNEREGDRLRVGPLRVSDNPAHGSIFMVTKGSI